MVQQRRYGGVVEGVLDELLGEGVGGLWTKAASYLPKCGMCGGTAVVRCRECGALVCQHHAFGSISPIQAVCKACMRKAFPWVIITPGAEPHPSTDEWPYVEEPWEILGVDRGVDADALRVAYREASKHAHPDRGGSAAAQAKVNAAYSVMMAWRQERSR